MVARLKVQYCKVIVLTSLVWILVDVCLLTYYTDCMMNSQSQSGCGGGSRERRSSGQSSTTSSAGFFGRLLPGGRFIVSSFVCHSFFR